MPDKLNVNELRKTLAPCQIRAEQAEFAKQTTTILNAVAASPARDTVEISDAAREAAGRWEYYESSDGSRCYRRVRGNDCQRLSHDGRWCESSVGAGYIRRDWRRMTDAEVDLLSMTKPAFAREHFAEHQSQEKPDRHAEQLPQAGIADPLVSDEQYVEAMRRAKLAVNGSHIDRQSFRLWLEAIALVAYVAGANSAISKIGGAA